MRTRFTRWTNPGLPQTLQIAVLLLYFEAALSVLSLLGTGLGGSAYYFIYYVLPNSHRVLGHSTAIVDLVVLAAAAVYAYSAVMIADTQRLGWRLGVGVATGAAVLPLIGYGPGILTTDYVFTYVFNIALVVLLLHTQSREYEKIWFE